VFDEQVDSELLSDGEAVAELSQYEDQPEDEDTTVLAEAEAEA
jgi:hypothetical protein